MPTYRVTDPKTGRTIRLTGDSPPSAQEIEQVLSSLGGSPNAGNPVLPDIKPMASHAPSAQPSGKQRWDEAVALADADRQRMDEDFYRSMGFEQVDQGLRDVQGGQYARGAHNLLVGSGTAALKMNPYGTIRAVVSAPVRTAASLATGYMGGKAGEAIAEQAGMTEDQRRLTGDIAMLAGGSVPLLMRGPHGTVSVRSPFRNTNQAERDAVAWGQRQGIPIDAATATNNTAVRVIQRGGADRSIGGSIIAARSRRDTSEALERTGRQLADRVLPTASSPEAAGEAVQSQALRQVRDASAAASRQYGRLRQLEQQSPVSVDLTATKKSLQPLYDRLMREAKITPLQGAKGRAAAALDRLMNAPDSAPLSEVDEALGALKAMARGADIPELRTSGQGVAATAVQRLEQAVRQAATNAGQDVLEALMQGRLATRAKFGAAATRKLITQKPISEPVKAYADLTRPNDASIGRLREVARIAPQQVREVGRAWLDSALEKATSAGGFDRSDALWRDWQNLGPATKRVIFGDQKVVADLDKFFLLTKKIAQPVNPSETALTFLTVGEATMLASNPAVGVPLSLSMAGVAKLLRNPRAVRLLNEGMQLRVGANQLRPARAIAVELMQLARREGAIGAPALADQQQERQSVLPAPEQ